MAVQNTFTSTVYNVWKNTVDNVWYGAEVANDVDAINKAYAVRKFYCTITGSPDIEIPISSFQGRRRNDNPTYLSVVTHDITYADVIAARSDGEIYIEMAYELFGVETEREEIIRAEIENITYDEGSKSQSITISGHKTESWFPKLITLTGETYKRTTNEAFTFRFSDVNVYVNPGDTVTVDDDTYIPSLVSFSIAATQNGINAQMELTE